MAIDARRGHHLCARLHHRLRRHVHARRIHCAKRFELRRQGLSDALEVPLHQVPRLGALVVHGLPREKLLPQRWLGRLHSGHPADVLDHDSGHCLHGGDHGLHALPHPSRELCGAGFRREHHLLGVDDDVVRGPRRRHIRRRHQRHEQGTRLHAARHYLLHDPLRGVLGPPSREVEGDEGQAAQVRRGAHCELRHIDGAQQGDVSRVLQRCRRMGQVLHHACG
mmetsp:Transcript_167095/g.536625  ORF Transcript_167095/g.536625 Transcript_167095/m.536625 type:complete len:223 (+) Transcript_167095:3023-3691(+)